MKILSLPVMLFFLANALLAAPVEITPPELRGGALQPQVAVAPGGRVHVTFGKGTSIYYVGSNDGGKTFSKPAKVADLPKLALGMRRGPRIAASDKAVTIAAISHEQGSLHAWTSLDAGAAWKETPAVNDKPNSAREGLHALASDGRGRLFLTWLDDRNGGKELWGAASADDGATWSANALVYHSPDGHICECCHPSATMNSQGQVSVMWRNWLGGARDMYLATSKDAGHSFGAPEKLGRGTWKLNGCPMDGGALAYDPAGKLLTTWRREGSVYSDLPAGAEQQLSSGAMQPVVVAGTQTYYLWQKGGDLMVKKGDTAPSLFAPKGAFVSAARLPKGGVFVTWESTASGASSILGETLP